MKVSVKNHLLKSVSQVLNECQKIVSILSDVQDDDEFCQDSDLWWDEDDVQFDVSSSFSDFSFISEMNFESENVVVEKFPCKFWWIPWQGDVKSEGDETNNTSVESPSADVEIDDDIKAEGNETNNNFLKLKKKGAKFNDPVDGKVAVVLNTLKKATSNRKKTVEDNLLQCKVLTFLSTSCPNGRYNIKWREERMRKMLPPDFFSLWLHFDLLTSDLKDPQIDVKSSPPVIRYPTIDITLH